MPLSLRPKSPASRPAIPLLLALLAVPACARHAGPPAAAKVLVINIDGADWQYVDPMVERGELPAFRRLMQEGAGGTLVSLPGFIMSPVVWTTIATGKGPMEHGIRSFTVPDPETGEDTQVTSALRQQEAFWNILSKRGRRVTIVGWSVTWPAEEVNGEMVSSFLPFAKEVAGSGFSELTWPDSLAPSLMALRTDPDSLTREDLRPFVGDLDPAILTPGEAQDLNVLRWAIACDETFVAAARELFSRDSDITTVFLGSVDRAGHSFMRYHDPAGCDFTPRPEVAAAFGGVVEATYRYVDGLVGELAELAGPETTVIVLSDHGFRSVTVEDAQQGWEWHRREGIVLFWGAGVKKGARLPVTSVFDITPTLFHLLREPQAKDMRGRPIVAALDRKTNELPRPEPVVSYHSDRWEAASKEFLATPQGEHELDLLRSLGYIR